MWYHYTGKISHEEVSAKKITYCLTFSKTSFRISEKDKVEAKKIKSTTVTDDVVGLRHHYTIYFILVSSLVTVVVVRCFGS